MLDLGFGDFVTVKVAGDQLIMQKATKRDVEDYLRLKGKLQGTA
jgi:antitoxin component of MazEF toxin-antitoxin module